MLEPPSNASVVAKSKYKKGEVKAKKIIIDSIQKHLVAYISNLGTSKETYDTLVGMYEVSNLNHILSLKNQLKDIKMNKGEIAQSYFMRISQLKDQPLTTGESIFGRELVLVALGGLPPIWETFITAISNNNKFPRDLRRAKKWL